MSLVPFLCLPVIVTSWLQFYYLRADLRIFRAFYIFFFFFHAVITKAVKSIYIVRTSNLSLVYLFLCICIILTGDAEARKKVCIVNFFCSRFFAFIYFFASFHPYNLNSSPISYFFILHFLPLPSLSSSSILYQHRSSLPFFISTPHSSPWSSPSSFFAHARQNNTLLAWHRIPVGGRGGGKGGGGRGWAHKHRRGREGRGG